MDAVDRVPLQVVLQGDGLADEPLEAAEEGPVIVSHRAEALDRPQGLDPYELDLGEGGGILPLAGQAVGRLEDGGEVDSALVVDPGLEEALTERLEVLLQEGRVLGDQAEVDVVHG